MPAGVIVALTEIAGSGTTVNGNEFDTVPSGLVTVTFTVPAWANKEPASVTDT